jgi:hypothetical protein
MPDLSDPLGPPKIVTGPEYMDALARLGYNVENMSSPLPVMSKIAQSMTSLVDNNYNQAMQWQQQNAALAQSVARTRQIGSETDNLDLQRQQNEQLFPLKVQGEQQVLKANGFRIKEAQRNADETDQAYSEYDDWHSKLAALDPTDPDYDNKVAQINAEHSHASTNPNTQRLISPLLQQQNVKRSQSSAVKQRTDQINQLQGYQAPGVGLIPQDTDIRNEVNAGRGQSLINQAKRQQTINRLQSVMAYGDPGERLWAQGQLDSITGKYMGPGDQPDTTTFGPNGDLNPGTEALLSTIERRRGITAAAPGAKKETKVETDTTGTKTTTTITGQPVTQQDITGGQKIEPATTPDMPTKQDDMQKDPVFQSVFSDLAAGKLVLPGDPKPGTPEYTAALFAEYAKRKGAASGQQQQNLPQNTIQPLAQPSPLPGPQRASKGKRGGLSYEGPTQEQTDLAIQESLGRAGFASAEGGIPSWWRPSATAADGEPSAAPAGSFSGSLRAMAYGPSQGEYTRATNYGPLGRLQEGDIAVSPNLLDRFPLGSHVDVIDQKGNVLRTNRRVADTSWINADEPTRNSFELWNDRDLGHARLVPVSQTERQE